MNHEWWQGYLAGGNESGYVPDGYIKLKTRRRDSAPIQNLPPLSITSDPSSSLNSINLTTSSNDQLDAPIVYRPTSDLSLVDEHRLETAKETEIVEVDPILMMKMMLMKIRMNHKKIPMKIQVIQVILNLQIVQSMMFYLQVHQYFNQQLIIVIQDHQHHHHHV
jgi:hypothetical protein